ncbi:DUF367 family protein [Candidatus Bathyarchaeota archaeon]|nr:DUF367 family protein [Candidatus Bathyarchaeota archaeon]
MRPYSFPWLLLTCLTCRMAPWMVNEAMGGKRGQGLNSKYDESSRKGMEKNLNIHQRLQSPRLHVLHYNQCDPKKCTSKRLKKHGLVRLHRQMRSIPLKSIKLNPFASKVLTAGDKQLASRHGLTVIDCSWKKARDLFAKVRIRNGRKLPDGFVAGNSINYTIPGKLSSVEALAAALIVLGFEEEAKFLLSKFRWGHTFLELNAGLIESHLEAAGNTCQ